MKEIKELKYQRSDGKKVAFEFIDLQEKPTLQFDVEYHRHSFTEILFIKEGISLQVVDFQNYEINEKQILVIPEGCVHFTPTTEAYCKGVLLLFRNDFFTPEANKVIQTYSLLNPRSASVISLTKESEKTTHLYLDLLRLEDQQMQRTLSHTIVQSLLLAFLGKLESLLPKRADESSHNTPIYYHFSQLLEKYYSVQKSISFYSDTLKVSPKKLNQLLKEQFGKSAGLLIRERIVLEAKRLLSYSGFSVKEIAFRLGFQDQYYFSRFFKKHEGVSPEQFKKQLSQ